MRGQPVIATSSTARATTAGWMSRNWRSPWTAPSAALDPRDAGVDVRVAAGAEESS